MPLFVPPPLNFPGYATGRFYDTWWGQTASAALAAVDVVYFYIFPVYYQVTAVSFFGRTVTGGVGSSIKIGYWRDSPISHRPLGAPVMVDNTGVDTSASSNNFTSNVTDALLTPGWYWAGTKTTGVPATMFSASSATLFVPFFAGGASNAAGTSTMFSFADAYANDMPTLAEGASFTALSTNVTHIGFGT